MYNAFLLNIPARRYPTFEAFVEEALEIGIRKKVCSARALYELLSPNSVSFMMHDFNDIWGIFLASRAEYIQGDLEIIAPDVGLDEYMCDDTKANYKIEKALNEVYKVKAVKISNFKNKDIYPLEHKRKEKVDAFQYSLIGECWDVSDEKEINKKGGINVDTKEKIKRMEMVIDELGKSGFLKDNKVKILRDLAIFEKPIPSGMTNRNGAFPRRIDFPERVKTEEERICEHFDVSSFL